MKKLSQVIVISILFVFVVTVFVLRSYKIDIIEHVVLSAIIQRAPINYPPGKIRKAFEEAEKRAAAENTKHAYMKKLLEISQRLEKIQYLNEKNLDALLGSIVRLSSVPSKSH